MMLVDRFQYVPNCWLCQYCISYSIFSLNISFLGCWAMSSRANFTEKIYSLSFVCESFSVFVSTQLSI